MPGYGYPRRKNNYARYKMPNLYNKYRPQRFSEIVGQPAVVKTLRNQIRTRSFSHAYLFTGTRGTGKTTCARILARAVNCENVNDGTVQRMRVMP